MPDLPPPPRRPAPERLRDEISRALDKAPTRAFRWRTVLVPVAAASLIGATIFGISTLDDRTAVVPSDTASPYPATVTPTPAPVSPTATATTPVAPRLTVRSMTKAEITQDTRSCRARSDPSDDLPRPKAVQTRYAEVELRAGVEGPMPSPVRVLLLTDSAGSWVCEDGVNTSWSSGDDLSVSTSKKAPVTEVPNYGGFGATCTDRPKVTGDTLFAVGDAVATGRMRLITGSTRGPWQTAEPAAGFIHFLFGVEGRNADSGGVSTEFQFLDQRGRALSIQPYGPRGTPTTTTLQPPVSTCADVRARQHEPEPTSRPTSDRAGIASCLALAKEEAERSETPFNSARWTSRLLVSTPTEWGAVLSDGKRRVGCSLFPTKEISPMVADTDTVNQSVFHFALNPIPVTDGESLWAAGRVPRDVTGISYRLPGGRDVAATINGAGYWMLKDHKAAPGVTGGDVNDLPPVEITISRASGEQTFTLKFSEQTMCNQVSHGC